MKETSFASTTERNVRIISCMFQWFDVHFDAGRRAHPEGVWAKFHDYKYPAANRLNVNLHVVRALNE